jgi:hypothetical protein
MEYLIYEGNMERLQKKLKRIENKCKKYGNTEFKFEIKGEHYKEHKVDGECFNNKYYIVEVEGVAKINDWVFVATIQHKDNGNIIRQFKTDVEIPEIYRSTDSICEHCNTKRLRKDTYLIFNEVTKEFKQVGKSCLNDFTNGLSAENVAQYISWFDEVIEGQEVGSLNSRKYYSVKEIILNAIETIKHYGFISKAMAMESNDRFILTTTERVIEFMFPSRCMNRKEILQEMEKVGYNAESKENEAELNKMLEWLNKTDNNSQYIYNLKTTVADEYCEPRDFGLLVSLPSAYFKAFEREQDRLLREQKRAEKLQRNANKQYVGKVGERLDIDISSVECITSFPTNYGMMRIYRFETANGDILVWKTSNFIEHTDKVKKIKATIKAHNEYKEEKQTEINRVKIVGE